MHELRFRCPFAIDCLLLIIIIIKYSSYIPKMKKASLAYVGDVFIKRHFLIKNAFNVLSGARYLNGVNWRAWTMAGTENK